MAYNQNSITVAGKRKTAIAKATIKAGKGNITINNIPCNNLSKFHELLIKEPIEIAKKTLGKDELDYDISVNVKGGGTESQIEASRLAIAKSLFKVTESKELKKAFLDYDKNILVADTRRTEPNKPGDSKARAKRQKSFR